jgi:hypothetical protein
LLAVAAAEQEDEPLQVATELGQADFIERLVMRVFDELVEVGARGGRAGSSVREVDVRADARRR